MKLYSHAGVSRRDGKMKVRFCNGMERIKTLIKTDHTAIDIVELRHPMTREEAVAFLLSIDFDNGNVEVRTALEADARKRKVDFVSKLPAPVEETVDNVIVIDNTEQDADVVEPEAVAA